MTEESKPEEAHDPGSPDLRRRRFCLDHARDLLASAERLLPHEGGYPNIAYHLAILALEETGKAGMLASRAVIKDSSDVSRMDRRLGDHVWKLMWGVWSPSMSGGKIDPKDFEEARRFAESTHARRMAGLYVDYTDDGVSAPPRQAVRRDHAATLLNLAKCCLEVEATRGIPVLSGDREELEWFLATMNDDFARQRLFNPAYIKKYADFNGDARAWVRWVREEFQKMADEEKAHLQRELARQASEPGKGKPKSRNG